MFNSLKIYILLLWLLNFSLALAADLKFDPTPIVEINKTITLSVSGTVGTIEWIVMKGKIQGDGNQITYLAPDQAGWDAVTVLDSEGNTGLVKVVINPPNDFSPENAQWEVFTNRSSIQALLLSEDGKTLWVGTDGGLEKRDAQTGEIQQVLTNLDGLPDNRVSALLSDNQPTLVWSKKTAPFLDVIRFNFTQRFIPRSILFVRDSLTGIKRCL
ncbi:two-component system sensor histidine kinase/response regulator [Thioploca ingrica]|uniref:Two-component system sensor histidine kinase/response regulator n=1 Tax=Thioploca ingrica TaxID=40754 RepID=A0A090AN89_9GAMM|nr:two-component system sensor histidine kinase/response regulator [Thioploca ingrica]